MQGFKPNTTQYPNFILDSIMPLIESNEFKVLSVIVRSTYGSQKEDTSIPLSDFIKKSGLSMNTIKSALRELSNNGIIEIVSKGNGRSISVYKICIPYWSEKDFENLKNRIVKSKNESYIYLIYNKRNGYYKIGKSHNPKFREKTLQSQEPEIEIIKQYNGNMKNEKELHFHFNDKHVRGEWFALNEQDLNYIDNYFKGSK